MPQPLVDRIHMEVDSLLSFRTTNQKYVTKILLTLTMAPISTVCELLRYLIINDNQ